LPADQFWIENEHSEFYIQAFQLMREWTNGKSFLIDGSNIEAKAVEHNFAGVNILRCTRHTAQSLKTRLSHAEDVTAVFAETLADCQYHLIESLKHCPYEDLKRYIKSQWTLESSRQWSLYARQDLPLVGEITTINPCNLIIPWFGYVQILPCRYLIVRSNPHINQKAIQYRSRCESTIPAFNIKRGSP
jgi:hypothetical protein